MTIEEKVKKELVDSDKITIAGIELHKVTASSFTLCEILDLSLIKDGQETKHPQFELLAFLWIHYVGSKNARKSVLDSSQGTDESGRSFSFINTVMDWADDISLGSFTELGQGIGKMLEESFEGAVQPVEEASDEGNDGGVE